MPLVQAAQALSGGVAAGHVNEKWLLHGTTEDSVEQVVAQGFDHTPSPPFGSDAGPRAPPRRASSTSSRRRRLLEARLGSLYVALMLGRRHTDQRDA